MGEAMERQQVMLAHREEGHVAQDHHLVVALFEPNLQQALRLDGQAAKDLFIRLRDSPRRLGEPFAIGVLADGQQQLASGFANAVLIDRARR